MKEKHKVNKGIPRIKGVEVPPGTNWADLPLEQRKAWAQNIREEHLRSSTPKKQYSITRG